MTVRIVHKSSSASGKNPTAAQLANAEIAVNYHEDGPFLSVKDTAGNVVRVGGVWIQTNSPPNPTRGSWWLDDAQNLYLHDGTGWQRVSGGGGNAGGAVNAVNGGDGITVASSGGPVPVVSVDLHGTADTVGLRFNGDKLEVKPAGDGVLGSVKQGAGVTIAGDGTISAAATPLTYKGVVDLTSATVPASPSVGDVYANTGNGNANNAWANVTGNLTNATDTDPGDLIAYKGGGTPADVWTFVPTGGATPVTNLGYTAAVNQGTVTSSTGTDATIPLADATNAGLFTAAEKTKLAGITAGSEPGTVTSITPGDGIQNATTNDKTAITGAGTLAVDLEAAGAGTGGLAIDNGEIRVDVHTGLELTANGVAVDLEGAGAGTGGLQFDGNEIRVKAGAGIGLTAGGVAVNPATMPNPGNNQTFGYWERTNASSLLEPATANDNLSTGSGTITSTGAITGGSLTASTGDVTVTAGNVTVTAGGVTVTAGDIEVTAGDVSIAGGTSAAPGLTHVGDTNTGIAFPANDTIEMVTGGVDRLRVTDNSTVINEDSADHDFRVEGVLDANLLLADAGNDVVGIGETAANINTAHTANGDLKLLVNGDAQVEGDVQSLSQNSGHLAGFRNYLINGCMRVWQRSRDFTPTDNSTWGYRTADRWSINGNSNSVGRTKRVSHTDTDLLGMPEGFDYAFAFWDKADITTRSNVSQCVELQVDDAGQAMRGPFIPGRQWTLSVYASSDMTATQARLDFSDAPNSPNSINYCPSTTWVQIEAPNTTAGSERWGRYSVTFTGHPTNAPDALTTCVRVAFGSIGNIPSPEAFTGVGNTSRIGFTGCQLEMGPVATPFEYRDITIEREMCYRYFQKFALKGQFFNGNSRATVTTVPVPLNALMRISQPDVTARDGQLLVHYTDKALNHVAGMDSTAIVSVAGADNMNGAYLNLTRIGSADTQVLLQIGGTNDQNQFDLEAEF